MQDQKQNIRQKTRPDFSIEQKYASSLVAGIDEAGRGPLAGPVVAACVILKQQFLAIGINDSKKLSRIARKKIFTKIIDNSYFGIGIVDEKIIDQINIFQATKLAMKNAYLDLCKKNNLFPNVVLFDGNFIAFSPDLDPSKNLQFTEAIVKGDSKSLSIAAASIIAKETRDQIMACLDKEFPDYGWYNNQAYGTKFHIDKIKKIGICKYHRLSFDPIKSMIKLNESNSL